MKVTVCELPDEREAFAAAWEALVVYVQEQQSELVLLPEMPFSAWFARPPQFDAQIWQAAVAEHDAMLPQLTALAPAIVLGTRPLTEEGKHLNRGFFWSAEAGYQGVHDKYYLPNEPDFYERNWFDRDQRDFSVAQIGEVTLGFLICTEVMFNEWARHYGRAGANIIAVPRAAVNHERWVVACQMAAIVSGAFVLSSNRVDGHIFGGRGLIIGPNGEVLAETSRQQPFATADIDLSASAAAQQSYPRDVLE